MDTKLIHQPVPVVALVRFVTEALDESPTAAEVLSKTRLPPQAKIGSNQAEAKTGELAAWSSTPRLAAWGDNEYERKPILLYARNPNKPAEHRNAVL